MDQWEGREKIVCGKKPVGKKLVGRGSQWEEENISGLEELGAMTEEKWRKRHDWVGVHGIAFAIGYGVKVHGIAFAIG